MDNYNEFEDLAGTGFENREPTAPEDEFFHSCYVAGQLRKNHIGIQEIPSKLQIRGVEYNKDKVCMIITHTKQVLCNVKRENNKDIVKCFSYQEGPGPWKGTSGNQCGSNSTDRAANPFCVNCRAQLLVTGILCNENGNPVLNEDKKPVFIFIRGKGTKYSNVSNYLSEMAQLEIEPIFKSDNPDSLQFERSVVNNKRFVTEITVGTQSTSYGDKLVFVLSKGTQIPNNVVVDVLKIAKKTLSDFNQKFDWSKNRRAINPTTNTTQPVDESNTIPELNETQQSTTGTTTQAKTENKTPAKETGKGDINNSPAVGFEDIVF